jgi:REP element-mobilizing transposase RayT
MPSHTPTYFNPRAALEVWRNRLPHWDQLGGTYFLTFRLADAVPADLLRRWQAEREDWLRVHPPPLSPELELLYHQRFSAQLDQWLDASHGSCALRDPASARIVADTLAHDDPARCALWSWVIMPNHIHVLLSLRSAHGLDAILKMWKGVSARRINQHRGTTGSLWQRDYFDRLVRDEVHFGRCVRYIRQNPTRAKLPPGEFLLWESDLAKSC